MAGGSPTQLASRAGGDQKRTHLARYAVPGSPIARIFRRSRITRHELPALLLAVLFLAWIAFTLHGAYAEGHACRERGGVILEIDERNYDSIPAKLCTADY